MESSEIPQSLERCLSFFLAVLHHRTWNEINREAAECSGKLSVDFLIDLLEVVLDLLADLILAHRDGKVRGALEYGEMLDLIQGCD